MRSLHIVLYLRFAFSARRSFVHAFYRIESTRIHKYVESL